MWNNLLLLFLALMALKIIRNSARYVQTRRLLNEYLDWVTETKIRNLEEKRSDLRRLNLGRRS